MSRHRRQRNNRVNRALEHAASAPANEAKRLEAFPR
jgi:hypothetical protein